MKKQITKMTYKFLLLNLVVILVSISNQAFASANIDSGGFYADINLRFCSLQIQSSAEGLVFTYGPIIGGFGSCANNGPGSRSFVCGPTKCVEDTPGSVGERIIQILNRRQVVMSNLANGTSTVYTK